MAVPKRRTSKTRKNKRRASAYRFNKPAVAICPNCGAPRLPHRVCRSCGQYDGKTVISMDE